MEKGLHRRNSHLYCIQPSNISPSAEQIFAYSKDTFFSGQPNSTMCWMKKTKVRRKICGKTETILPKNFSRKIYDNESHPSYSVVFEKGIPTILSS